MSRSYAPGRRPNAKSRERQEKMLDLLEEHGPLTEIQLSEKMHVSANIINQMVWTAHEQHKVHIAGQTLSKLRRNYEVNLWGAGCKPDVLSPVMQRRLQNRIKGIEGYAARLVTTEIRPWRDPMLFITAGMAA